MAIPLSGGRWIVEHPGTRPRLNDGAFPAHALGSGTVGATPPCLSRRAQGAASHLRPPTQDVGGCTCFFRCFCSVVRCMYEEWAPGFLPSMCVPYSTPPGCSLYECHDAGADRPDYSRLGRRDVGWRGPSG